MQNLQITEKSEWIDEGNLRIYVERFNIGGYIETAKTINPLIINLPNNEQI
jgi:hypothetical protein